MNSCLILGLCFPLLACEAADTNAVVNGWLDAQAKLRAWSADFVQTRTLKALRQPLVATGHVWFAAPNRFRWEIGSPAQTIALRESDQMLVIYPRLKRAERYPLDSASLGQWRDALALLEAGFPRRRSDLQSRFRFLSVTKTNGTWQIALQPVSPAARRLVKEIRVDLRTNDFSPANTELIFADDSRMRNDFTNAVFNAPQDEALYHWKPDPEFKITEPLGK